MAQDAELEALYDRIQKGTATPEDRALWTREVGDSSAEVQGLAFEPAGQTGPAATLGRAAQQAETALSEAVQTEGAQAEAAPAEDPNEMGDGLLSRVGRQMFPPTDPKLEEKPAWWRMPELRTPSWDALRTQFGAFSADPQELADIITTRFPKVKKTVHPGGYVGLTSEDGQEYMLKPGLRGDDLARAGLTLAATTGAGMAAAAAAPALGGAALAARLAPYWSKIPATVRAILTAGGIGAAETAALETGQAAAGGKFNTRNVGLGGALNAGTMLAARSVPAARSWLGQAEAPLPPGAGGTTDEVLELAARSETSDEAAKALANVAKPNPQRLANAQDLGVEDLLPVGALTDQPHVQRGLQAAIPSKSDLAFKQAQNMDALAAAGTDKIRGLAGPGARDLSANSVRALATNQAEIAAETKATQALFEQIKGVVGEHSPAPAKFLMREYRRLKRRWVTEGTKEGRPVKSPLLDQVNKLLRPRVFKRLDKDTGKIIRRVEEPSYAVLDDFRKLLGAAQRGKGAYGTDPAQGLAKWLYKAAKKDQMRAVKAAAERTQIPVDQMLLEANRRLIAQKTREKGVSAIFGKNLNKDLVGKTRSAVEGLADGKYADLDNLVLAVPKAQRAGVLSAGIAEHLRGKPIDAFIDLMDGLKANPATRDKLFANLPTGAGRMFEALHDIYVGSRNAMKARGAPSDVPPGAMRELLNQVLGVARLGTLSLPWRWAGAARMIVGSLKNPGEPGIQAAYRWLEDPKTRRALIGLDAMPAASQTWLKQIAENPSFIRFAKVAQLPPDLINSLNKGIQATRNLPGGAEE